MPRLNNFLRAKREPAAKIGANHPVRHAFAHRLDESRSGAMHRNDYVGVERRQRIDRVRDIFDRRQPEDIAKACLYLSSEAAEFVTGIVMPVDGGSTAAVAAG